MQQIQFRNESSGEYQFFMVAFKCLAPEVTSSYTVSTPVRQSAAQTITVHNPLSVPVTMNTSVTTADISLPPHFVVPPGSDVSSGIDYCNYISVHILLLYIYVCYNFCLY